MVEELDVNHRPPEIEPVDDDASGTRIGAGIRAAVELHEPRFAGYQDMLLLSDGDDPANDGGDCACPPRRRGAAALRCIPSASAIRTRTRL